MFVDSKVESVGAGTVIGSIIGGVAVSVLGAYALHLLDAILGIGEPKLSVPYHQPVQATGILDVNGVRCGDFGGLGCAFGTLDLKISNDGDDKASNCRLLLTENFHIKGARGSDVIRSDTSRDQSRKVGENLAPFEVGQRSTVDVRVPVQYPYLGDYSFTGRLDCDRGDIDIPESHIAITT